MYYRQDIQFKTQDSVILRGWFYSPKNQTATVPGIIMTHGFSALKEHYLSKFAEVFVEAGMCVLVYDNRNFGESDGKPRFEVDPVLQVQDMRDAITFMQTLSEVDAEKIGLWGTSFSGGNVLVVAATDKRARCVVAQVPFVKGHHAFLQKKRPDLWEIIQNKYAADHKAQVAGKRPMMTPVVTKDPEKSAVMNQPSAYKFFTSVPKWENQVTLKSVENAGEYNPIEYVQDISPVPVLFIVADQDTVCITDLELKAYEEALPPKKLVMIEGEHFAPYIEQFEICSKEACGWFKEVFIKTSFST